MNAKVKEFIQANERNLANRFGGKFVVLKEASVIGVFATEAAADLVVAGMVEGTKYFVKQPAYQVNTRNSTAFG